MGNPKTDRQAYWQEHTEAYRTSGLTQREYCRQNNISYYSFNSWKRRLQAQQNKLCEISPETVQKLSPENKQIEIIVDDRIRILTPDGFSKETLLELLRVLGAVS